MARPKLSKEFKADLRQIVKNVSVSGEKELTRKLQKLETVVARRIIYAGIKKGMTTAAREIRKRAPVGKRENAILEETGVKESIGSRFIRGKGKAAVAAAKAGIGVGKKKSKGGHAPHAHLVALGTALRQGSKGRKKLGGKFAYIQRPTEKQLSTGQGPQNPFVKKAIEGGSAKITQAILAEIDKQLKKELATL